MSPEDDTLVLLHSPQFHDPTRILDVEMFLALWRMTSDLPPLGKV